MNLCGIHGVALGWLDAPPLNVVIDIWLDRILDVGFNCRLLRNV